MNFLAHIYLSGDSRDVLVGNFIGDYVKGKEYLNYPEGIQEGIWLHRKIDSYTDHHPITLKNKRIVRQEYRLYAGIVVDIYYDHFLAAGWEYYSDVPLKQYVRERYRMLDSGFSLFPEGVKAWFPYFIKSNWLETYTSLHGLSMVFKRMSYRTSLPDHSDYAVSQLQAHYEELRKDFRIFFGDMLAYVNAEFGITIHRNTA